MDSKEHLNIISLIASANIMLALNQRVILATLYPHARPDMKPIIKESVERTEQYMDELKDLMGVLTN